MAILTFILNFQAECLQKMLDLHVGEMRLRDQLIERFSKVVQPSILQLRGHGLASEALLSEYQGLVRQLQGIRSVTWDDETTAPTSTSSTDSGVSSCTDVTVESEENTLNKQKLLQELNNTFTLPQEKPQTISAEKFMAKGGVILPYVSAVFSEILHSVVLSYRTLKEN